MTKLLEEAIAKLRGLPESDQNMAARFLLEFANPDMRELQLSDAQVAEVKLAQREVRDGNFATDAEMAEVWRRFDS
jgi:hypothetical protein